jgi:hypothetical protein
MASDFNVGLLMISRKLSLAELTVKLGQEPQSGSHDKDTPRSVVRQNVTWPCTVWRANASDPDACWHEQCLQLLRDMPQKCVELVAMEPNDISVLLSVAAFYRSAYFDLVLPSTLIGELCRRKVDFEITAYPTCDEATPGGERGTGPILGRKRGHH